MNTVIYTRIRTTDGRVLVGEHVERWGSDYLYGVRQRDGSVLDEIVRVDQVAGMVDYDPDNPHGGFFGDVKGARED